MRSVVAILDAGAGELRPSASQVVAAARQIAGDGSVTALVSGTGAAAAAERVGFSGVERAVVVESGRSDPMPVFAEQVAVAVARECAADAVVLSHGPEGMSVAPAIAMALDGPLVTGVTALREDAGEIVATRAMYGGKVSADFALPAGSTGVLTLQPGAFAAAEPGGQPRIETAAGEAAGYESLGFVEPEAADVDIARADLLVSVGRGIGDEENVEPMQRLAAAMGGELGASRPLVDAGWVAPSRQVGQSGRTVKPKVYLAFGISGAVQHLAGIREAGTVIAINTDAEAPIFRLADYGVVADALEVAEHLERLYSA